MGSSCLQNVAREVKGTGGIWRKNAGQPAIAAVLELVRATGSRVKTGGLAALMNVCVAGASAWLAGRDDSELPGCSPSPWSASARSEVTRGSALGQRRLVLLLDRSLQLLGGSLRWALAPSDLAAVEPVAHAPRLLGGHETRPGKLFALPT